MSQAPIRIGIQGVKAAFHDVAARRFAEDKMPGRAILPIECPSFKILGQKLKDKSADLCVMAIENAIAGSILTNYSLLETEGFKIIGEVYLRIKMNLLALPGQTMESLTFVQSHPMALLQCEEFLSRYPEIKILNRPTPLKALRTSKKKNYTATPPSRANSLRKPTDLLFCNPALKPIKTITHAF